MRPALLLLLVACGDEGTDPSGGSETTNPTSDTPVTTGATGTTATGGVTAACETTDNALRFACTATFPSASAGAWTVSDGDTVVRTFTTPSGTAHDVTLWGLAPEKTYTWAVSGADGAASGTLTTGALPSGLDDLAISVSGTAEDLEAVLFTQTCGTDAWLLVAGTDGAVRWYEPIPGGISAFSWTDAGTVLYTAAQTEIHELWPSGEELYAADGFDLPLHHDLYRGGDYVYALNANEHDGRVIDGFYVLQDGNQVASWDLADHATITGTGQPGNFWDQWFPGATDWGHANSIWSDGTDVLVSERWQDAAVKIVGDPNAADFGEIQWILTGTTKTDLDSDFTWTGGGQFDGQHHITPTADGLALFDNEPNGTDSRGLLLTVDDGAFTVKEKQSWSVGEHCDIEGAAYPLPNGGMLVTCATSGYADEFSATSSAPVWTIDLSCGASGGGGPGGGGGPSLQRVTPIPLH